MQVWIVRNAGGTILSVHETREAANAAAEQIESDNPGTEFRVVPEWYDDLSASDKAEVDGLLTLSRQ